MFPTWYLVLIFSWILASYFFLTIFSLQTLYEAIPILLILLIALPLRLIPLVDFADVSAGYIVCFVGLTFFVAILITVFVVGSERRVFKQLFEMHRQKECFRKVLSSYPEGVLIAKITTPKFESLDLDKIICAQNASSDSKDDLRSMERMLPQAS